MPRILLISVLSILLSACSRDTPHSGVQPPATPATAEATTTPGADTVYLNGRIYTVDEEQPWAEAVAITGDRLVAVGSGESAKAHIGSNRLKH